MRRIAGQVPSPIACKRLCHDLVFILVHDITDPVRLQHLHRDLVVLENCDQLPDTRKVFDRALAWNYRIARVVALSSQNLGRRGSQL